MTEVILEPVACETCGQHLPNPKDGHWRWAKSGKVFDTEKTAHKTAASLNSRGTDFEFRAALDDRGRYRIASRRRTS